MKKLKNYLLKKYICNINYKKVKVCSKNDHLNSVLKAKVSLIIITDSHLFLEPSLPLLQNLFCHVNSHYHD